MFQLCSQVVQLYNVWDQTVLMDAGRGAILMYVEENRLWNLPLLYEIGK